METLEENMIILEISDVAVPNSSVYVNQMPYAGEEEEESTDADYTRYEDTEEEDRCSLGRVKVKKNVSFKTVVVNVTFNEDWEMHTSQTNLRTEDQQRNSGAYLMRNF